VVTTLTFLQHLLNGIFYGLIYALISTGLSLIFGVMEVVNFAHGEFYMLGAFIMYFIFSFTGNFLFAVLGSMAFMALFGVLVNGSIIQPVIKKSWMAPILVTLGLGIALKNTILLIFGAKPIFISVPLTETVFDLFGLKLQAARILILFLVPCLFAVLHIFLQKTKIGKGIRAASQNRELCDVLGIELNKVYTATFLISACLAGLAGSLVGPIFCLTPTMGDKMGIKSFCIVVLGGFGNVKGAIFSSILVGLVESLVAGYISGTFKDAFVFILMLLTLLFKPEGLLGKRVGIW